MMMGGPPPGMGPVMVLSKLYRRSVCAVLFVCLLYESTLKQQTCLRIPPPEASVLSLSCRENRITNALSLTCLYLQPVFSSIKF